LLGEIYGTKCFAVVQRQTKQMQDDFVNIKKVASKQETNFYGADIGSTLMDAHTGSIIHNLYSHIEPRQGPICGDVKILE